MRSGPRPSVELVAFGSTTVRWMTRGLSAAYEPGQWGRGPERPGSEGAPVLNFARRRFSGELPAPAGEPASVAAPMLVGLSGVPEGWGVRFSVRPGPDRRGIDRLLRWVDAGPPPLTPRGSMFPGPPGPSAAPNRPYSTWAGWFGTAQVFRTARPDRGVEATIARTLDSAWTGLDGAGLSAWRPWMRSGRLGRFLLTEPEMLALLPPRAPVGTDWIGGTDLGGVLLPFGRSATGGSVGPSLEPHQGRHLAILGETGMGKSSLLVAIALRAAREGTVILLDPLGETTRELRDELGDRDRRVVALGPVGAPRSLNALEGIGALADADAIGAERRVADIVHALRRVRSGRYSDSGFWGPRLEEMLTRAIRAAASFPNGTLEDAHTLLSSTGLTRRPLTPGAGEAVTELAARVRARPDDADGARRLLHEVVRNPALSSMLCARTPELSLRDLVRPLQVLLVSGDAAQVGESTARYLLSVYLALVWSQLLSAPSRTKTFVLLDEAQWFAHESLAEMLRLARRRNVHVVLATQSVASLPEVVQEALWTNVADFVAFRGLPEEAREIGRMAPGVTPARLLGLRRGEAVVLLGKGAEVRWVRTARVPPAAVGPPSEPPNPPSREGPARVPEPEVRSGSDGSIPGGDAGAVTVGEAVDWIRGSTRDLPEEDPWPLPLIDLRARYPGDPDLVRRLGALLGRSGALRRSDRSGKGPVWWIDLRRLPADPEGGRSPSGTGSSLPKPS